MQKTSPTKLKTSLDIDRHLDDSDSSITTDIKALIGPSKSHSPRNAMTFESQHHYGVDSKTFQRRLRKAYNNYPTVK
jgi:hypothetical protein